MIVLSGGFDPLHPGHIDMIRAATQYGPVCIVLNSDDWLVRKKGFFFQNWKDRAHILRSVRWVSCVEPVDDSDDTVCSALETLKPQYFGNGGDRTLTNTPELDLCRKLDIEPVFGLGGSKSSASSTIGAKSTVVRDWGRYTVLDEGPNYKVKRLVVDPMMSTSLQKHEKRKEFWIYPGIESCLEVPRGEEHRLTNPTENPLTVIEVQVGKCEEADIERI